MGCITILPDAVADQIAAGEVVERPASVVKELVENALDAGASEVVIALEGGGRSLVSVADNGQGMDRDDAIMALDRHATSKLSSAADLVGIPTYGFRGEAIPAIASVAKLEIETAVRVGNGSGDGTKVKVDGGRLLHVESVARQPGTTVTVRRLFFNAPARRKFLRSQAAETRAATQALTNLALARLDVAFELTSDDRVLIDAPRVSNPLDRIEALFGRALAETLIPVDGGHGPVTVRGFIQRPADAKPTGRKAFLFVNGRPFRDPFLVRAAEAGYRATIHPGDRPSVILALAIPGESLDVNVHPAKHEVRFRDRRLVEGAVEAAVRSALGGIEAAAVVRPEEFYANEIVQRAAVGTDTFAEDLFSAPDAASATGPFVARSEPVVDAALLQVFDTYIVQETPHGLAVIDQHSAHERVLYEKTMDRFRGGTVAAQRLLLPLTFALEPEELLAVEEHAEELVGLGYEVEPFGGNSVVIHAVPNPHPRFDARRCFEEMVADLARGRFGGWNNQLERFCATFACRAAIKAGQRLDVQEMRTLLRLLFACELPPHDVHGRPTIVQLPRQELERRFGRA